IQSAAGVHSCLHRQFYETLGEVRLCSHPQIQLTNQGEVAAAGATLLPERQTVPPGPCSRRQSTSGFGSREPARGLKPGGPERVAACFCSFRWESIRAK